MRPTSAAAVLRFALLSFALVLGSAGEPDRAALRAELQTLNADLARLSRAYTLVHELVAPSVVAIYAREREQLINWYTRRIEVREVPAGVGSGFVVASDDKSSWIVTNAHVVFQMDNDGSVVFAANGRPVGYDRLRVVLHDNREFDAEYVGQDVRSDLALIKVPVPRLPVVDWADSDRLHVGDFTVALGYPLGVGYSATFGNVSATDRSTGVYEKIGGDVAGFEAFVQTDAAINPGNSGGPLVDLQGRIIGVNSNILSSTKVNIGLGFAIPANQARRVVEDVLAHGKVIHAMIGITLERLSADAAQRLGLPAAQAVAIGLVYPHGPAAEAKLQKGDVVLAVNRIPVASDQQFRARIAACRPGAPITVRVFRAGKEQEVAVTPISTDEMEKRLNAAARSGDDGNRRQVVLAGFGLSLGEDEQAGLPVVAITPNGAAARNGIEAGDRILAERTAGLLRSAEDVLALAGRREVVVKVIRNGRAFWVQLRR